MTLLVSGNDLYVGGNFTNVDDNGAVLIAADYIARWDGSHWYALGSGPSGDGALNSEVRALGTIGASLYVGGYFSAYHGANRVAGSEYIDEFGIGPAQIFLPKVTR